MRKQRAQNQKKTLLDKRKFRFWCHRRTRTHTHTPWKRAAKKKKVRRRLYNCNRKGGSNLCHNMTHAARLILASCLLSAISLQLSSASAIPIWEFLSRNEKVSQDRRWSLSICIRIHIVHSSTHPKSLQYLLQLWRWQWNCDESSRTLSLALAIYDIYDRYLAQFFAQLSKYLYLSILW